MGWVYQLPLTTDESNKKITDILDKHNAGIGDVIISHFRMPDVKREGTLVIENDSRYCKNRLDYFKNK